MHGLLSILIWLPIGAGILILVLGDARIAAGRWLALVASLATLALAVPLWTHFDPGSAALQFPELAPWIPRFKAFYCARRRRHLHAAHAAHRLHDGAGGDRRLERDRDAPGAVLRRVPRSWKG